MKTAYGKLFYGSFNKIKKTVSKNHIKQDKILT